MIYFGVFKLPWQVPVLGLDIIAREKLKPSKASTSKESSLMRHM